MHYVSILIVVSNESSDSKDGEIKGEWRLSGNFYIDDLTFVW